MNSKIMPHHLQQPLPTPVKRGSTKENFKGTTNFHEMLSKTIENQEELKISKHAEKRLLDRGIVVPQEVWNEIHSRVKEAHKKGINDSLVLTKEAAFVVNAKNETVITAMDRKEAASQLFTNINGAIIIND